MSGSGISWAICKSASRSRQITLPLSFLQAGCPSCRPTNSVKALKKYTKWYNKFFSWTAVSILVILNHNSFRVLFDKTASAYLIWKKIYLYFSTGDGQPMHRHCASCIGALSFSAKSVVAKCNFMHFCSISVPQSYCCHCSSSSSSQTITCRLQIMKH